MMHFIKRWWKSAPKTDAHPVRCEVLVVEDKDDEAALLAGLLRMQGAIVTRAKSIGGALDALSRPGFFQIAFVDLGLPDGSGYEVMRRIVDSKRMTHVVVTTGAIEKVPLAMSYGYVGLLGKPYTSDSVRRILWVHRLPYND